MAMLLPVEFLIFFLLSFTLIFSLLEGFILCHAIGRFFLFHVEMKESKNLGMDFRTQSLPHVFSIKKAIKACL